MSGIVGLTKELVKAGKECLSPSKQLEKINLQKEIIALKKENASLKEKLCFKEELEFDNHLGVYVNEAGEKFCSGCWDLKQTPVHLSSWKCPVCTHQYSDPDSSGVDAPDHIKRMQG